MNIFQISSVGDNVVTESSEVGGWFQSFIELGVELEKGDAEKQLEGAKLLLVTPAKEFIALAIAFGFSVGRALSRGTEAEEISLDQLKGLPAGTRLRLEWEKAIRTVIFIAYTEESKRGEIVRNIECEIGGSRKTYDAERISRIAILPSGYPEGDYTQKAKSIKLGGFNSDWMTQLHTGMCIFSGKKAFEEQLDFIVEDPSLSPLLGSSQAPMSICCRIRNLSFGDATFNINLYDQFKKFPSEDSDSFSRWDAAKWTILDGNESIANLTQRDDLIPKRVLSILDLGDIRSQSNAIAAHTAAQNRTERFDIQKVLKWAPPHGCGLLGWH